MFEPTDFFDCRLLRNGILAKITAADLDTAIKNAKETNCREIFIIGGGEIYKQSIDRADKIYMTRVQADPDADTFFPAIDETKWALVKNLDFAVDGKHAFAYSFQTWEKKQ